MACGVNNHKHTESCNHWKAESPIFKAAIMVTRVALAALAFIADPYLFLGFFAVGLVFGVYKAIRHENKGSGNGPAKGCGNDFLEKIANATFPPEISFFIGAMTFACHIEHHPLVFVPLMGGAAGYWMGQGTVEAFRFVEKKAKAFSQKGLQFSPV